MADIDREFHQHCVAYDRAALLTTGCAEALKYRNPPEAFNFFQRIKNKFPRHSAFQAELRQYVIRFKKRLLNFQLRYK
jgi:hypothetical protein